MYRKRIDYKDFHDFERSEIYEFNLSEPEIVLLESSYDGSITEMLDLLSKKEEQKRIPEIMNKIILLSYGVTSEDGKRFMKSDELRTAFEQTNAYSVLFMELTRNAVFASEFFEKVISQEIFSDQ